MSLGGSVLGHTISKLSKGFRVVQCEEYKPIREIRFKNAQSIGIIIEGA